MENDEKKFTITKEDWEKFYLKREIEKLRTLITRADLDFLDLVRRVEKLNKKQNKKIKKLKLKLGD